MGFLILGKNGIRDALIRSSEGVVGFALAQAEAIERLTAKVVALRGEDMAELEAKPDHPRRRRRTISSIPPNHSHKKTTEFVKSRRKKKPHTGAARSLHANPTHERDIVASVCDRCGPTSRRAHAGGERGL